jgi:hypothetical protein
MKVGVECWAPFDQKYRACRNEARKKYQGGIVSDLIVNYETQHAMTTLHATLILSGKVLRYKS